VERRISAARIVAQKLPERFDQQGAIPTPSTPQEYIAFIKAELAKWAPVVQLSGAKVD
jgi:hypothetical protein